ncbi:hypothetical protein ES288_A07G270300v1 [Gossypium darwinii]|uniref:Uncharacterized protein n=1 Tax=Gossypium darwinii TaxID=34276 RepID=A0A5D2G0K0_GOSDA|nr:hypothetical protein ES288_A07G270300v1 [Gossypium darwinii]
MIACHPNMGSHELQASHSWLPNKTLYLHGRPTLPRVLLMCYILLCTSRCP